METLTFGRSIAAREPAALEREWLVTNGIGGFAMGTLAHVPSRSYHGLLVAALRPPVERTMLLSKVEETAEHGGVQYELFANRWRRIDTPLQSRGYRHHERFRLEGSIPSWTFALGGARLEKRVWMEHGENTTYLRYDHVRGPGPILLSIKIMVDHRDFHLVTRGLRAIGVEASDDGIRAAAKEGGSVWIRCRGATIQPVGVWHRRRFLAVEHSRGEENLTDDLHAATFEVWVPEGGSVTLAASTTDAADLNGLAALERRRERDRELLRNHDDAPPWIRRLVLAADQFVVRRAGGTESGTSVIAGYPWFADWGRDTMIALPGLLLATGRFDEAADVLRTYVRYVDQGMIPNRFPDDGGYPHYNTVDGSLWFFDAVARYVEATGDRALLAEVFDVLAGIIEHHRIGTRFGIGVDPDDGLLRGGHAGTQLTWMDAKVEDWVVTPRIGKPVEANALWYRALRVMGRFSRDLDRTDAGYDDDADQVRESFGRFWSPDHNWCFDVIDGPDGNDAALRPNQLFALSLEPDLLDDARAATVLAVCAAYLHTSLGLRTLAPFEADYEPEYGGDRWTRDGAYHQGTVWPWLLGPYITAHHRVHGDRSAALELLEPLIEHFEDHGIGSISEVADGDPPHAPHGAPFQAWSVAEALRVWHELGAG